MATTARINDGGPAFPNASDVNGHCSGLSLRDYFAGQALIGILGARHGFLVDVGTSSAPGYAYQVADGMLAERAKPGPPSAADELAELERLDADLAARTGGAK